MKSKEMKVSTHDRQARAILYGVGLWAKSFI